MADKITAAYKETNPDTSVKAWHISYEVDDGGDNKNSFVIVIKAEDMTDATDAAEAKTKANVKAGAIKTAWLSALDNQTATAEEPTLEGDVTL